LLETVSLYVHIPFCRRRCPYCAFYSIDGAANEEINEYPRLILEEFALRSRDWRGFHLGSVYFGGGTPSLLTPRAVQEILDAIKAEFAIDSNLEVTLEANPGTIDQAKCEDFIRAGINRLSLGIQALDDGRLHFLGRIHDHAEGVEALRIARNAAGEVKVSTDLMIGTPGENVESWDRELDALLSYKPDGISFYSLTLEEGTQLAERAEKGENVYLPAETTVDLLLHIGDRLKEAGYCHYEVSNWALTGSESRHNLHYWHRGKYLGLGPSAHSFDGKKRRWNLPILTAYRKALGAGQLPPSESETLSRDEVRSEWVYLSLRLGEGLDYAEYEREFGEAPGYWKVMFEKISRMGLGDFDGRRFKPNDRGLLLADEIAARVLG